MHTEEFGFAYNALNDSVRPDLESKGFKLYAGVVDASLPFIHSVVSMEMDGVELSRTQQWKEIANGEIVVTRKAGLQLKDLPADHPYNIVLADLHAPDLLPLITATQFDLAWGPLKLTASREVLQGLEPSFADKLHVGLAEFLERVRPAGLQDFVKHHAELLLLTRHAAKHGLVPLGVYPGNVVKFGDKPGGKSRLSIHMEKNGDTWSMARGGVTAAGQSSTLHELKVEAIPGESLIAGFDRTLAVLRHGASPDEVTVNYLLSQAETLKDKGFHVTTRLTEEVRLDNEVKLLEISVGRVEGDALVSARHTFSVLSQGQALYEVAPSVRFLNLPANHPDNQLLSKFDALPPFDASHVIRDLRKIGVAVKPAGATYGDRLPHESGLAVLGDSMRAMTPSYDAAYVSKTPTWATSLAQMMHVREIAHSHGFTQPAWSEDPGCVAFRSTFPDALPSAESDMRPTCALHQVFQLQPEADGRLTPISTHLTAVSPRMDAGQLRIPGDLPVPGISLENAAQAAFAAAMARKDDLLLGVDSAYFVKRIGECWLESVDIQGGVAQVGIASALAGKKLRLAEVALDGWTAKGLTASSVVMPELLGLESKAAGGEPPTAALLERYAAAVPKIEQHVVESATAHLQALEKEAGQLKIGEVRLSEDRKNAVARVAGPDGSGEKELTFDIQRTGGQVVLSRADEEKARRPFRSVAGVRALELLLAPVVSEMLAKGRPRVTAKAKARDTGR